VFRKRRPKAPLTQSQDAGAPRERGDSLVVALDEEAQRKWGDLLSPGLIVRFGSPTVVFEEALAAGQAHAMEFFPEMLGGLRQGHARELRDAGFFSAIRAATGRLVDVGCWEEVKTPHLPTLVSIIDITSPQVSDGVQHVLADLKDMVGRAQSTNCSIGFML
jgi:hypothetical protein